MDKRAPDTEAELEDKVKATALYEKKRDDALFGYARFDILANKTKLKFHTWNFRAMEPGQSRSLCDSFKVNGLDR